MLLHMPVTNSFWVYIFEHSNGILDADYIFTILTRPIMGFLGESSKRSSFYIVDLINFHQTEKGCADQKIFILKTFLRGGWL